MRRRPLLPLTLALGLSLSIAGAVHAGVGVDNDKPLPSRLVGYYEWRDQYHGGEQSLPYGLIDARTILDHADGLVAVSYAVAQLEARGYVRRPDGDVAGTQVGFSFAAMAFEKPGYDIDERQPVIIVTTRAVEVQDVGFRPATMLYAAMFRDSAGVVVIDASPADSAIAFMGELTGGSSVLKRGMNAALGVPRRPDKDDESFVYRYSAFEEPHGTWQYRNTTSPGMQMLMSQAYQHTAWSAAGGAATGFANGYVRGGMAGGVTRGLVGGYISGYVAWHQFWLNPPDTSRVVRKR